MLTEGHHDMKKDEINMITGVLSINEKTVVEIMTNIDAVFMLSMLVVTLCSIKTCQTIRSVNYRFKIPRFLRLVIQAGGKPQMFLNP